MSSDYYGFRYDLIELTKDSNEAFVLNFLISCIGSNCSQKILKRGEKYVANLSYSTINSRFFWLTPEAIRQAIKRLKKKEIIQTLYNDYSNDRFRVYTLTDKYYSLFKDKYFVEGKIDAKPVVPAPGGGGTGTRDDGTSTSNNNLINNLNNSLREETACGLVPSKVIEISEDKPRISLDKWHKQAVSLLEHYNTLGLTKHALTEDLIKNIIKKLKKQAMPLEVHFKALDNYAQIMNDQIKYSWPRKWSLASFITSQSAFDNFYPENFEESNFHNFKTKNMGPPVPLPPVKKLEPLRVEVMSCVVSKYGTKIFKREFAGLNQREQQFFQKMGKEWIEDLYHLDEEAIINQIEMDIK